MIYRALSEAEKTELGIIEAPFPCVSITTAANLLSVTPRTVRNWLRDPIDPMPATCVGDGPPLIHVGMMMYWLMYQRVHGRNLVGWGGRR